MNGKWKEGLDSEKFSHQMKMILVNFFTKDGLGLTFNDTFLCFASTSE